jgi:hypothetical protein
MILLCRYNIRPLNLLPFGYFATRYIGSFSMGILSFSGKALQLISFDNFGGIVKTSISFANGLNA